MGRIQRSGTVCAVISFRLLQENKNTLSVMNKEIRALLEESAEFF